MSTEQNTNLLKEHQITLEWNKNIFTFNFSILIFKYIIYVCLDFMSTEQNINLPKVELNNTKMNLVEVIEKY